MNAIENNLNTNPSVVLTSVKASMVVFQIKKNEQDYYLLIFNS